MKTLVLTFLAACALALGAPQLAGATEFHGVVSQDSPGDLSVNDFQRMGAGNVGTLRLPVRWKDVESRIGRRDWRWLDSVVYNAARFGVRVLPVMTGDGPTGTKDPPTNARSQSAFANFMYALAWRYGHRGVMWRHWGVYEPIKAYQIYNEQNGHYWGARANPKAYGKLVKAAARGVRSGDRAGKIVLGGMYGTPQARGSMTSWSFLKKLYSQRGFKRSYHTVAIHPYAVSLRGLKQQILKIRRVLRKERDRGASIRITELGWGSGVGGSAFNKGPSGQAQMLKAAYGLLERKRRAWKIVGADWFSWKDNRSGGCSFCPTSGLFSSSGGAKPAWEVFRQIAAR